MAGDAASCFVPAPAVATGDTAAPGFDARDDLRCGGDFGGNAFGNDVAGDGCPLAMPLGDTGVGDAGGCFAGETGTVAAVLASLGLFGETGWIASAETPNRPRSLSVTGAASVAPGEVRTVSVVEVAPSLPGCAVSCDGVFPA